jgi:hypothetical protein
MPDGNHLLVSLPVREGVTLYNMDIQTGEA